MTSKPANGPDSVNQPSCDIQQELLRERRFSLADVIGREGGTFMKGASPIPPLLQAKTEINLFIDRHLADSSGVLKTALQTLVTTDDVCISQHLDAPLEGLRELLERLVDHPEFLYEFVKQVDIQWGQFFGERPYFQQPGQTPHPDDEYTHESVHQQLVDLLNLLVHQSGCS